MGESLINQVLHDTYRVESVVDEGGEGNVYEAAHLRLGRRFVIKIITPEMAKDPEAIAQFQKDWSTLSAMEHRHIVEVTDMFPMPDKRLALVMEALKAQTLADRLKEKGRFEVSETALVLRQVASGLQSAHKKRVIHNHLNPKKILLCKTREKDDHVKIVGFGKSAKYDDKAPIDELNYLAPEQLKDPKTDHRVDAYSMAAMLFEMLTGKPPLSDASAAGLVEKIKNEDPPALRTVRDDIPEPVEYVIAKSLRKEGKRRYPSLGALSREFSSTLSM